MNRLYWCEAAQEIAAPDFGGDFHMHIASKKHPAVRCSSLNAWALLAAALRENGCKRLPEVYFSQTGKPYFANRGLHFSLSHSGKLAAVILSDAPCGVDIELVRPYVEDRLLQRCLSAQELSSGCDFFDIWTKKECIAKLEGSGMPGKPACINTLDAQYENRFFTCRLQDSSGQEYALSALANGCILTEKKTIIEG